MEPPSPAAPDRVLLVRLQSGDREALAPLMERHYARLYRLALSYLRRPEDAVEVAQEAFVKAYQNAGRWDGSAEPASWLSRIAVNLSIDRYRRLKRRAQTFSPMAEGDHEAATAAEAPTAERRLMGQELGARIASALRVLPDRQRAVFVLRHYEEMSLEEIAGTLGMSLGTVKSSLHRAVHRLRDRLEALRP
jgi:RNA polymerase sigma-70 factor (ECF subfamily)